MTGLSVLTNCARVCDNNGTFRSKELKTAVVNAISNGEIDKLISDFCGDLLKMQNESRLRQIELACRVVALLPDEHVINSKRILTCLREKKIVFSDFSQIITDAFIDGDYSKNELSRVTPWDLDVYVYVEPGEMSPGQKEAYEFHKTMFSGVRNCLNKSIHI